MTTDTKAVARWDIGMNGLSNTAEILWHYQGRYILFTDHERVVGELKNRIDVYDLSQVCDKEEIAKQAIVIRNKEFTNETLRTALAASRAEAEELRKDAERYRWLRGDNGGLPSGIQWATNDLFDTFVDEAMEKVNV